MMTTAQTDEALIPLLAKQDESAVGVLLERYWGPAFRVALQVTGDPVSAEDVAQDTFVRVLQAAHRFEGGRAFKPWFFQVLVNTARNQRRTRERLEAREARAARPDRAPQGREPEAREEAALVREHLGRLSPKLREVLALRYLEGLSLAEVAASLECPEGTVSSRIRRGLEALRSSLLPTCTFSAAALADQVMHMTFVVPPAPPAVEVAAGAVLTHPLADVDLSQLQVPDAPPSPSANSLLKLAKGGALWRPLAPTLLLLLVSFLGGLAVVSVLMPGDEAGSSANAALGGVEGASGTGGASRVPDAAAESPSDAGAAKGEAAARPRSPESSTLTGREPANPGASADPSDSLDSAASSASEASSPLEELKIAWDPALGALDLNNPALVRLVGRALYQGLPAISQVRETPDGALEFLIGNATWSDGQPVLAQDFAQTWDALRATDLRARSDLHTSEEQLRLLKTIGFRVLGPRRLEVHGLDREDAARLNEAPFLPASPQRSGATALTNGPYRVVEGERRRLRLDRVGPQDAGPRVISIHVVPATKRPPRSGFHMVWSARWGVEHGGAVGLDLNVPRRLQASILDVLGVADEVTESATELSFHAVPRLVRPKDGERVKGAAQAAMVVPTRRALAPVAGHLVTKLRQGGVNVTLGEVGDPTPGSVVVLAGVHAPDLLRHPFLELGYVRGEFVQGECWVTDPLDRSGYLRYPPPLVGGDEHMEGLVSSIKDGEDLLKLNQKAFRSVPEGPQRERARAGLAKTYRWLFALHREAARVESRKVRKLSWLKRARHLLEKQRKLLKAAPERNADALRDLDFELGEVQKAYAGAKR